MESGAMSRYTGPERRDPTRRLRIILPGGKPFHMSEAELWEALREARHISKSEDGPRNWNHRKEKPCQGS